MKTKISITLIALFFVSKLIAQFPHAAQLYGVTQYGGPDHKGSIFHFTPSTGAITIDYNFQIKVKGKSPKSDIVAPGNGKYYGTTTAGGVNGAGIIFEWDSATSVYKEVFDFAITEGQDARGAMQLYNGKLYGMTNAGGVNGYGVIYEFDFVNNVYTKKYDMDSLNGMNPDGSLLLVGNTFYGFTRNGGANNLGVLFEWNPNTNAYTKKYDFTAASGSNPVGKFAEYNGKLYAMAHTGGVNNLGVIYEYNYTTNTVTKKYDFNGVNGQYPLGSLTFYNGKFYGMTYEGGTYEFVSPSPFDHFGVIFEWNPVTNAFAKKKDLGPPSGLSTTRGPLASFTVVGNALWAMTSEGAGTGGGCIIKWEPASNLLKDIFYDNLSSIFYGGCEAYSLPPGRMSYTTLLLHGNNLLGTTSDNTADHAGGIFEYSIDSVQVTRSVYMQAFDAHYPEGKLARIGNKLFGCSQFGGQYHNGNVFEWDLDSSQFKNRFEFNGYTTGLQPRGELTAYNGKLYGLNLYSPTSASQNLSFYLDSRISGEIYSWDPVTNQYQTVHTGNYFSSSLKQFGKHLYFTQFGGFPYAGGNTGYSAILRFNPNTLLVDTAAILPNGVGVLGYYQDMEGGNNITYLNGKYYGLASSKTLNIDFKGTIYEWDTTQLLATHLFDFDISTGTYPLANLLAYNNALYGLTTGISGGSSTFFKYEPSTQNFQVLKSAAGGTSTPVFSEGKFYYLDNSSSAIPSIIEYDPVLDTLHNYQLPGFPGSGLLFGWYYGICKRYGVSELLEVIPNKNPLLSNIPAMQTVCSHQNNTATFTLSDADNDTMNFQITSSNPALIPLSNISITNADSVYTIHYFSVSNQTGSDTILITANDGYGGSVNFSFVVVVNASPTNAVAQNSVTLTAQQSNATYQWIDCSNNTPIANATGQSFTATVNGNYAVAVSNANCTDTSACVAVTTVGKDDELFQNTVSITPNPANDDIKVTTGSFHFSKIEIYNTLGERVKRIEKKTNKANITVRNWPKGIYYIKIYIDKNITIKKFAKE